MTFVQLRTEVSTRFASVSTYFKATRSFSGTNGQIARGMSFVHIYAAYEFTVISVMQTSIDEIITHGHLYSDLSPTLLSLFLHPKFQSVEDCSPKNQWSSRFALVREAFSNQQATISNAVFPSDGSHFRYTHLQLIFEVLGIRRPPTRRRRHLYRINEVVDHRNAIAHGRETAESIGRRYSRVDVHNVMKQMRSVCLLLISATEAHCNDSALQRR